jgi:hypothetical protein
MNMLFWLWHETIYSDFDYFEIRLRVLLKNSAIYLKNGQKNPSEWKLWRAEIWHEFWHKWQKLERCMSILYFECFKA